MASSCKRKTSTSPTVRARPIPPSMKHTNIGSGRRFPIKSRSTTSSFGFSAARKASPINVAVILAWPVSSPCPTSDVPVADPLLQLSVLAGALGHVHRHEPQFRYRHGHREFDHPAGGGRLPPIRMNRARRTRGSGRILLFAGLPQVTCRIQVSCFRSPVAGAPPALLCHGRRAPRPLGGRRAASVGPVNGA